MDRRRRGGDANASRSHAHSTTATTPSGASRAKPPSGSRQDLVGPIPQLSPSQVVRIPSAATAALSASDLAELALFAGRFASPAAALGMLFIPTNKSLKQEGYLPGYPPIRYLWYSDERSLILSSLGLFGVRWTDPLEVGLDGLVRDHRGQVVGRILANSVIIIDRASVGPKDDPERYGPTLCPPPSDEGPGRGVAKDRDYEDYVKKWINPQNPTPRGFSVVLPNPSDHGAPVKFDDRQGETGAMIEAKGTGYEAILQKAHPIVLYGHKPGKGVITGLLEQSRRQIQACADRAVHWYFAEQAAADRMEKLFDAADKGRERIRIIHLPWKEGQTWK